jgi:hypothetical protein
LKTSSRRFPTPLRHGRAFFISCLFTLSFLLGACSPKVHPHSSAVSPPASPRPLTSATIFTEAPVQLSLERLTALATQVAPGSETFPIAKGKSNETPFLVVIGETELRTLCGYEGDFPGYLERALRPAVKASAGNDGNLQSLRLLSSTFKDVVWFQIVPAEDSGGKTRALIRALAKELGGTIYSEGILFGPSGQALWSPSGITQARFDTTQP